MFPDRIMWFECRHKEGGACGVARNDDSRPLSELLDIDRSEMLSELHRLSELLL